MRKHFYYDIDKESKEELTAYLKKHFRYNTMNSWNQSTSYACNLKIHSLGLESDIVNNLYELIQTEEFYDSIQHLKDCFNYEQNYRWQAGFNGRSGGYLVLYQGGIKPSGYKSFCIKCGQQNFTAVEETGIKCGKCGEQTRRNYEKTHMSIYTKPGLSIDMYEDFGDWDLFDLQQRAQLVQQFDKLADSIVDEAVNMVKNYSVQEETFYVPKTRYVLTER